MSKRQDIGKKDLDIGLLCPSLCWLLLLYVRLSMLVTCILEVAISDAPVFISALFVAVFCVME